eukprot:TRINITY_DN67991_c5_g3_i1.p1 TRINITY_DN67991_c5_g3~~TRINITY_DN67991_c5_g3_i1.p1  ORF type:complete len:355 (-),score=19.73 TRINITY_DN67991_c5_g3_i1:698-1735(-)
MPMKVVIFGGGGFIGSLIVKKMLSLKENGTCTMAFAPNQKTMVTKIVLFDVHERSAFLTKKELEDDLVSFHTGDIADPTAVATALNPDGFDRVTIFHLASILSGQGEQDFELCMKVNLHGTLNVLNQAKLIKENLSAAPIIVFTSTVAIFDSVETITEESTVLPLSTYGATKGACELLVCDYTRKGYVDGRVPRLPTITGRPEVSPALSYAFSGVFNETLRGKDYTLPLPLSTIHPVSSPHNVCECLMFIAGEIDVEKMGHNRRVCLPAKSYTLQQMWDVAQQVAQEEKITIGKISVAEDPTVMKVVTGWPKYIEYKRATELGFPDGIELVALVRQFVQDYLKTE